MGVPRQPTQLATPRCPPGNYVGLQEETGLLSEARKAWLRFFISCLVSTNLFSKPATGFRQDGSGDGTRFRGMGVFLHGPRRSFAFFLSSMSKFLREHVWSLEAWQLGHWHYLLTPMDTSPPPFPSMARQEAEGGKQTLITAVVLGLRRVQRGAKSVAKAHIH